MKRGITCAAVLALALTLWGWTPALARDENGDGIDDVVAFRHWHGRHAGTSFALWAQLNDGQKAALKAKVDEMRAAGTSRKDIHAAVGEMLTGFGVELPENWDKLPVFGRRGRGGSGWGLHLTGEQRTQLKTLVEGQRAAGATWADIREAVDVKLNEWGIERPKRGLRRPGSLLTEGQRAKLKGIIDGLKAENATRADIRKAIGAYFQENGIELPKRRAGWHRPRFGRRGRHHGPTGDASHGNASDVSNR